jgi:O-antigen ligase
MFNAKAIAAKLIPYSIKKWPRFDYFVAVSIILGAVIGFAVVYINKPYHILLGVGVLIGFLLSLYSLEFGLLFLVFISYTRFSEVLMEFQGLPSVAKPFLAIMVVSIIVRWAVLDEKPKGWLVPTVLFGVMWTVGLISLLYSPVPDRVWARLLDDAKDMLIAIVVVVLCQRGPTFRRVMWVLIGVGFFLGTLAVYQYFTGTFNNDYGGFAISQQHQIIGTIDDYRSTGPMGDPNFFAQIMVTIVPLSLERFLHEKRNSLRLIAIWTFAVSVLTILFTYSRGGFLALLVAVVVLLIYYPPQRFQIPIIIVAVVAFIYFLPPNYLDRLSTLTKLFEPRTTNRIEERSLQGRLSENLTAWEMVRSNPLFGVGLSSYNYLFPIYSKKLGIALVATEREAHNLYLEVLAETGIIGFSVTFLLLFTSFETVWHARRLFQRSRMQDYAGLTTGFFAGLAGYFTAAVFIHNAFPRFFFLLLGIALSLRLVAPNTIAEQPVEE